MRALAVTFAVSLFVAGSTSMLASVLPIYGSAGTGTTIGDPAPLVSLTAVTGTSIGIYFAGSSAADSDFVDVFDVTPGHLATTGQIFNVGNGITAPTVGTEVTLATSPGDIILVELINTTGQTPPYDYYSVPSMDSKGVGGAAGSADTNNHIYTTPFTSSDNLSIVGPPASTLTGGANDYYIGMEDEIMTVAGGVCTGGAGVDDCDYNDEQIVLTNVSNGVVIPPSSTPEPGSIALLGTGILGAAGMIRRRVLPR